MFQESTTVQWGPVYIDRDLGPALRLYILFLLASCLVTVFNVLRVWRAVPLFSTKRPPAAPDYLKLLQLSASRCGRWIGLIFLTSGLLTLTDVYDTCSALRRDKIAAYFAIVPAIQDFSVALTVGLSVVLFLYLARWHILTRIENFRD
jgi:hypothetical protein